MEVLLLSKIIKNDGWSLQLSNYVLHIYFIVIVLSAPSGRRKKCYFEQVLENLKIVMVRDGISGQKMAAVISSTCYAVFCTILAPIPNFIHIGRKTQ